jgi:hypothetical protein
MDVAGGGAQGKAVGLVNVRDGEEHDVCHSFNAGLV